MLAFEELFAALKGTKTEVWCKGKGIRPELRINMRYRVNDVISLLCKAEYTKNFDDSETARDAINDMYDFAVKNKLVIPGKVYLYDKLLAISQI